MTENTRAAGKKYEADAVDFLVKKNFKILEKNYRAKSGGEIDIIAVDRETVVFVEVKAREKMTGQHPFEAVDIRKQKKIIRAAREFLTSKNMWKNYMRFDVVGIITENRNILKIEHAVDAFGDN